MADLTIRYNNSALPKGEEIDVVGVGPIKNGGQLTVDEVVQDRYEQENGVSLKDALAENPNFNLAPDETKGEKNAAKVSKEQGLPSEEGGN